MAPISDRREGHSDGGFLQLEGYRGDRLHGIRGKGIRVEFPRSPALVVRRGLLRRGDAQPLRPSTRG